MARRGGGEGDETLLDDCMAFCLSAREGADAKPLGATHTLHNMHPLMHVKQNTQTAQIIPIATKTYRHQSLTTTKQNSHYDYMQKYSPSRKIHTGAGHFRALRLLP